MKPYFQLISISVLLLFSSSVLATSMCVNTDVHLSSLELVTGGQIADLTTISAEGFDQFGRMATSCEGLLSGNDQPLPETNIGQYMDGLLNGEPQKAPKNGNGVFDPLLSANNSLFDPFYLSGTNDDNNDGLNDNLAFIDPTTDLQDIDGDDIKTDPGWVFLGKDEGSGFSGSVAGKGLTDGDGKSISVNINDILDISFTCASGAIGGNCTKGAWSIMPDVNIVATLFPLFGDGFFDHLAFVIKTGNVDGESKGGEFAIYDFDFNIISNELGGGIDLTVPYNLSGNFDLGNTFGGKGISHISVWARDPLLVNKIPEPSINLLLFFGVGLVLLRLKSHRRLI